MPLAAQIGKYSYQDYLNWDETLKLKTFNIDLNLREIFEKTAEDEG